MNILKIPREAALPREVFVKMNLTLDRSKIKATIGTVNFTPCGNYRPHFTKTNQDLTCIYRSRKTIQKNALHLVAPAFVQSCVASCLLRTVWMKILEMKTTHTQLAPLFLVSALSIAGIAPLHRLEFELFSLNFL